MAKSRQNMAASEAGEVVAIQALAFIAEDGERLGRFLAVTGTGPAEIRLSARNREFLAGVLDYLMGDEALLVQFAGHAEIDPATIAIARRALDSEDGSDEP